MTNSIVEALSQLEKAIGLEPLAVPANISELVTTRKFTGTEFLKYVGEEYLKQKTLSPEKAAIQRDYLAGMLALAKMAYVSDGATQAPLPTVQDYTREAMVAWRAYQVRLEPVAPNPANAGGTPAKAYKSAEGGPESLTVEMLQAAFAKVLEEKGAPMVEAALVKAMAALTTESAVTPEVIEPAQAVAKSEPEVESAPAEDPWAGRGLAT